MNINMVNFFGSDQIKSVQNGSSLDFYLSKHVNIEKCHDYHENKHVQAQGSRPRGPGLGVPTPRPLLQSIQLIQSIQPIQLIQPIQSIQCYNIDKQTLYIYSSLSSLSSLFSLSGLSYLSSLSNQSSLSSLSNQSSLSRLSSLSSL